MADLTTLYGHAPALVEAGERVLSTDEMTGIQALERKHPTRLMEPGQAERREFEYIRRGTVTLIAKFINPKAWCAWSPSMTRFPTTWGTRVSVVFSGL